MQTWRINGQTYTHAQLMELKKQGLDPRKDKIEMKFVTKNNKGEALGDKKPEEVAAPEVAVPEPVKEEAPVAEVVDAEEVKTQEVPESLEEEFERLKTEKAWVNNEKKGRYNELKEMLNGGQETA